MIITTIPPKPDPLMKLLAPKPATTVLIVNPMAAVPFTVRPPVKRPLPPVTPPKPGTAGTCSNRQPRPI